jgi:electron transport complex protein RnfG
MAKKESSLITLMLSLTIITFVAASALAAVYSMTKGPIEQSKLAKKNNAIQLVLPDFDPAKGSIEPFKFAFDGEKDSLTVFLAIMDKVIYGAAVETYTNQAFSGRFDIMVGFDKEGVILGSEVLKHNETPGLGDKIDKSKNDFPLQFNGRKLDGTPLKVKKDGGNVDAITAATITSRAFCDAVDRAFIAFKSVQEKYTALQPQSDSTAINQ